MLSYIPYFGVIAAWGVGTRTHTAGVQDHKGFAFSFD